MIWVGTEKSEAALLGKLFVSDAWRDEKAVPWLYVKRRALGTSELNVGASLNAKQGLPCRGVIMMILRRWVAEVDEEDGGRWRRGW